MNARNRWIDAVELQKVYTGWHCPGGIARKISARTGVPIADIVYPPAAAAPALSSALEYIRALNIQYIGNEGEVNLG